MKYYIKTFGCQQNEADSQRIHAAFAARGMKSARGYNDANYIIVNTCMVREKAENKAYGLINNLSQLKTDAAKHGRTVKIIVTGCMVGVAFRDSSGKYLARLHSILPGVDEFMPIEEVGFNYEPVRMEHEQMGLVPISNGCNNFCTFCVVPFTRGREISRPIKDILEECRDLKTRGYTAVMLLGQNVNSYGADLILGRDNIQVMRDLSKTYFKSPSKKIKDWQGMVPTYVKHLGRQRLPTLFPHLLKKVAQMGFAKVDFISSNPWDFSDELIAIIAQNKNITRTIHLPVQSGDNAVLKRMNRWYTRQEYLALIQKIKAAVPGVKFTTDIIVGFCDESDEEFNNTYTLCQSVHFFKAYISMYSQRPFTAATKAMQDSVQHNVKKQRWEALEKLINIPNLPFKKVLKKKRALSL